MLTLLVSKCFMGIAQPCEGGALCSLLKEKEIEAQNSNIICSVSHDRNDADLGLEPRPLSLEPKVSTILSVY